jgi:hypothetical protein
VGEHVSAHLIDFERVTAWHAQWETAHAHRWRQSAGYDRNGRRLYRPTEPMKPLPLEPPSASVIREIELQLNGRVLSPAPKETP